MTMSSVAERLVKINIERLRAIQNSGMLMFGALFSRSFSVVVRSEMRLE